MQLAAGASALALVLAGCALLGFWQAFSTFNFWDDEGYFLLALRRFQEHGGLYEEIRDVFYGPFYFEALGWGARLLHVPLASAAARWLMLAGWAGALAAAAFAAWRIRGSLLAGALACAIGFPFLLLVTNEPLHATSLVLPCLALLFFLCLRPRIERAPGPATMAACGALCAAIALVKLNVGLFVLLAFLGAYPPAGDGRAARVARGALALALVLAPFALMRVLLELDWVQDFALLVSASLVPFALQVARAPAQPVERRAQLAFAAAGLGVALVSIGGVLCCGTTLAGLWRSLVLDALAFPLTTHHAPPLPARAQILLEMLVLPLGWAVRGRPVARDLLQIGAGLFALLGCLLLEIPFAALPLVWLLALGAEPSARRTLIGLCAVLLALQAFPQAGSQLGLFSFLVPLVALLGIGSAWSRLARERLPRWLAELAAPALSATACCALLAAYNPIWSAWRETRAGWTGATRLDLPGTGPLRLPEARVAEQHWLAANLRQNADAFVGVPGVPSAHVWSGVPAPVPFYAHHWPLYYDRAREEALTQALLGSPRPCIVRDAELLAFWIGESELREGPFRDALEQRFALAGRAGPYELWLPRTAQPELVLSALPAAPPEELLARHGARRAFRLRFPDDARYRIARIALHNAENGFDLLATDAPTPARRMVALSAAGAQLLGERGGEPLDPCASPELLLLLPPLKLNTAAGALCFRASDAEGRVVARLLLQLGR